MGGKSQKQTQNSNSNTSFNNTSTAAPPSWAAPHLEAIVNQAQNVYGNSQGYTGAFSPESQQGLNLASRIAQGGNQLGLNAYTNASNLSQLGGLNPAQRSVLGNMNNEYLQAGTPTSAQTNLSGYASGSMLSGNPYLDKMLETTNEGIANRTNGLFSGAGRSFSPAHAAALAKNIAASDNQARYTDYDRQVQNQFNANQMIDNSTNARTAQRTGILGQQFGGEQQGIANMLGIGQNAGAFDNARYMDANTLRNVGQQIEGNQATMASIPWQNLQNYLQGVRGASQGFGTTNSQGTQQSTGTQTTTAPGPSILQQVIGGGMTGLGLASGFGGGKGSGGSGMTGGNGGGGKGMNNGYNVGLTGGVNPFPTPF